MEEHNEETCGHNHEKVLSTDEIVEQNNFVINALIDLLIDKKVITESELNQKFESIAKEFEENSKEPESKSEEVEDKSSEETAKETEETSEKKAE